VLTIPILGQDVPAHTYDLFMGHEVGHALYTPLEGMRKALDVEDVPKKLFQGILNIVEDSRIERKIRYKYPGLKNSFVKAYKDLYEQNFFGTEGKEFGEMNLVDRINLHEKIGAGLNIQFNETERDLLNDVATTETYDDVIEVSRKIYEHIKQEVEEQLKEEEQKPKKVKIKIKNAEEGDVDTPLPENMEDFDGEIEIEFDENFDPNKKSENNKEDSPEIEVNLPSEEKTESAEQKPEQKSGSSFEERVQEAIEEAVRAFTDEAYKSNENKLFDMKSKDYAYVNIPKFDLNKAMMDYKVFYKLYKDSYAESPSNGLLTKEYNKIRVESNKIVSYLVKEFELRKNADQMKRAKIAKTGELNLSKIYSYNFSEDIFKKITTVPNGKSHGLVMFLDWSGSMTNHIENTMKQLISLVLFCKKVNIPYEVYAFADSTVQEHTGYQLSTKPGDIRFNSVSLVNLLSSRMSASEFLNAASAMVFMSRNRSPYWFSMSGTPLNEAIVCAMDIVPQFQKRNRLQIVNTIFLTDGESNGTNEYYRDGTTPYYGATGYFRQHPVVVIRDPVNRHEERFEIEKSYYHSIEFTKALVKLLRHRTHSHVVGFYLVSTREFNSSVSSKWYGSSAWNKPNRTKEKATEQFKKNRFAILDNSGFDEYYFLRSNRNEEGEVEFEVEDGVSKRGLVSAFSKFHTSRIQSRTVLTRFIQMIS
jgi:hypothetical protein